MATTQLPSILTSLEIPFVTCVSVPVIRHGSMKSLCPSVSWRAEGRVEATTSCRNDVSKKSGKLFTVKIWLELKSGMSCYRLFVFGLSRSIWCLCCIEVVQSAPCVEMAAQSCQTSEIGQDHQILMLSSSWNSSTPTAHTQKTESTKTIESVR